MHCFIEPVVLFLQSLEKPVESLVMFGKVIVTFGKVIVMCGKVIVMCGKVFVMYGKVIVMSHLPHYIEACDKIFYRSKPLLDQLKLYRKWA